MRHPARLAFAVTSFLSCLLFALAGACDGDLEPGQPARGDRIAKTKCAFCHYIDGNGGMIAPPMEKSLAQAAALVKGYEKRVADLKMQFPKAYAAEAKTIEAVLAEKDLAKRFELWATAYIKDTKFDNPMTKMGNVILTAQERADVVAWLMARRPAP